VVKDNVCFNDTMGSVRANVNGGVPAYKFAWTDTSEKLNVNTGLISGVFPVTITDANNCTLIDSVKVGGSTPIVINLNVSDTVNIGKIEAAVSGGKEPLIFQWTGPNGFRDPATKDLSGLIIRGNYTLKVTDGNGCEESDEGSLAGIVGEVELSKTKGYKLFPNPSNDVMFLDFEANISGQYALYSLTGNLIREEQFSDQSVIEISKPNNGVYILDLMTKETRVKYKLIFQD
jgi:hypothetical protein